MPLKTTLEHDLMANAVERIAKWRKDTMMRCDVVDLPKGTTIAIIYSCLVGELIAITIMLGMSKEDFCILMQHALAEAENKYEGNQT